MNSNVPPHSCANVKNPPKIRLTNSCACNYLTSFEYEVHGITGNGRKLFENAETCMNKFVKSLQFNIFLAGFSHLKLMCPVPVCLFPGSHSHSGSSATAPSSGLAPNRQGHLRSHGSAQPHQLQAQQHYQQQLQHQQQQQQQQAQQQHHLGHRRALPPAPVLPLQVSQVMKF